MHSPRMNPPHLNLVTCGKNEFFDLQNGILCHMYPMAKVDVRSLRGEHPSNGKPYLLDLY